MNKEQALQVAREWLLGDDPFVDGEQEVGVSCGEGHSGVGWYGWLSEYPEEGSVFLGTGA